MTKQPLKRYVTTVSFAMVVAAASDEQAEERIGNAIDAILERCGKTTFTRLPGKPYVDNGDWNDITVM